MAYNSIQFLWFFAAVYALYLIFNHRMQNWLLLVASYFFYGFWNWRFIPLLLVSTWISYYSGLKIDASDSKETRLRFLKLTVYAELLILGIFKYFNFFADNVLLALRQLGLQLDAMPIRVALPLGISYFTFQAIAYSVDVHRKVVKPCRSFRDFALFKSFFPILFSGPIERAGNLIPQILSERKIDRVRIETGLYLIGWGLFKKALISDNIAKTTDLLFKGSATANGLETWLAAYSFAIQLYCDFSGYTDIARGLGSLLGFNLAQNFNLPYVAQNPVDFWRRWHMSMSTWFNDYVYQPFFFKVKNIYVALFTTFFLIGMWHGASWNFVLLGVYNAIAVCGYVALRPTINRLFQKVPPKFTGLSTVLSVIVMFHVTCFGFLFFRADSLTQVEQLLVHVFTSSYALTPLALESIEKLLFFTAPLFAMEAFQLVRGDLNIFLKWSGKVRFGVSLAAVYLFLLVYLFSANTGTGTFIYFQF